MSLRAAAGLEPGHGRGLRSHSRGHFRLSEAGPLSSSEQLIEECKLLFEDVILPAKRRVLFPPGDHLFMRLYEAPP